MHASIVPSRRQAGKRLKIPVLCYHSMAIEGNDYGNNDHVALAADLEVVRRHGFEVLPAHEALDAWLRDPGSLEGRRCVVLTCDDGSDFDFTDLPHPVAGVQRSFLNILRDARARDAAAHPRLHITSFVIVSPEARALLDVECMIGRRWWNDHWWRDATASGLMGIANHSWDHNHDRLPPGRFPEVARGTFSTIDREDVADYQVAAASAFLHRHAPGPSAGLFAYPYGESNAYLAEEYLPRNGQRAGVRAAFATIAEPWTRGSDRWRIPRYMFRRDWKSPAELERILADAA
jgi:peptidoglycan/xylan/chitin deacetylase (PgdA/CDA1 family)